MDLSIILVNWNTREFLLQCLDSIVKATTGINYEIIVVDNASEDGSVAAVKSAFPSVKILQNDSDAGYSRGWNGGFQQSSGRYVMLLGTDTVVLEGTLQALISFIDTHQDAAMVGCKLLNPDGSLQVSTCFNTPSILTLLYWYSPLVRRLLYSQKERAQLMAQSWLHDTECQVSSMVATCMVVRRKAIEECGYLDEGFLFHIGENEWCVRFRKAGWSIYFTPKVSLIHYGGQSMKRMDPAVVKEALAKDIFLYWRKYYGAWSILLKLYLLVEFSFTALLVFLLSIAGVQRRRFSMGRIREQVHSVRAVLSA